MAGKKAHLKLSVAQHHALLKALKGGELGDVQSLEDIKLYVEPGQFGGKGLWSDLKSVVAKAQKSPLVQDLEKKAIHKGSEALQKFATKHAEGIGDLVAETIGLPKGVADSAIKRSAATATGPLLSSALQASEETSGEYRVDFEYANSTAGAPVGTCLLGNYDASTVLTTTQDEQGFMAAVLGTYGYFDTTNNHTRASLWAGAQTTPFVAERAATVDKVTEVGISAPGLSHGSYSSSGSSTGATLARFQVTGRPGTNMVYRPSQPIKIDASHLINTRLQEVSLALVDQHGTRLDSLQGEKYSVVLVVEWEE